MNWIIYTLRNPRTNEVRYVGWTSRTAARRMNTHIQTAVNKPATTHKAKWILSLLAIGLRPAMEVIESGTGSGWGEAEQRWIAAFRAKGARLTNATDGGEGTVGYCPTPETRELQSRNSRRQPMSPDHRAKIQAAALKANVGRALSKEHREAIASGNRGTRHSPEAIEKTASVLRGRVVSAETRCKLSARKLKPTTDETRAKMSATRTGKTHSKETRARISASLFLFAAQNRTMANTIAMNGGAR